MILDMQSIFSDAQAIVASAVSTNVIDFGATEAPPIKYATPINLVRDQGKGEPTPLLIQVVEAFDNLTTLKIDVEKSVDAAFTVPVLVDSQTIVLANLAVGQLGNLIWYPLGADFRFARINYTVVGVNPTVGKITAGLTMGVQTNITG